MCAIRCWAAKPTVRAPWCRANSALPANPVPFDLTIEIAGLATRLIGLNLDDAARRRIESHYADFILAPLFVSAPAIPQVQLRLIPGEPFLPFDKAGWYALRSRRGELILRPLGNPENFLRVLTAWRCLAAGALLVHAGGVIRAGRGWVFFGPSGSGKTTTVRLSGAERILSDDLVILKTDPSLPGVGVRVYGTPFRGNLPETPRSNASAALTGLLALVKAPEPLLAPLPAPVALARLAACVPFVMTQPAVAGRVLALCRQITAGVPPRLLYFRRDPGFWSVLDD